MCCARVLALLFVGLIFFQAQTVAAEEVVHLSVTASDSCELYHDRAVGAARQVLADLDGAALRPGDLSIELEESTDGLSVKLTLTEDKDGSRTSDERVVTPASLDSQIRAMTRGLLGPTMPLAHSDDDGRTPAESFEPSTTRPPVHANDDHPPRPRAYTKSAALPSIVGTAMMPFVFFLGLPAQVVLPIGITGVATLIATPGIGHYRLGDTRIGLGFMGLRSAAAASLAANYMWMLMRGIDMATGAMLSMSVFSLLALSLAEIAITDRKELHRSTQQIAQGAASRKKSSREPALGITVTAIGGLGLFLDEVAGPGAKTLKFGNWGLGSSVLVYPKRRFHGGLRLDIMWAVVDGYQACDSECGLFIGYPGEIDYDNDVYRGREEVSLLSSLLLVELKWRIGDIAAAGLTLGGAFRSVNMDLLVSTGLAAGLEGDIALWENSKIEILAELRATFSDGWWSYAELFVFVDAGLGARFSI